ncbi:DUF3558 family protein [Williamsia sp.]|uniref:DUF3558 family protein n=1 Tax=Williamsia sp. TaxID=1872085 RepID=UPI001A18E4E7|nr:DUF3558 family protein [Williamsia sp.]MBJ7289188.1 DUF3558 family protein [Williamsia sp.]
MSNEGVDAMESAIKRVSRGSLTGLAVVLCLGLTACGSDDKGSPTPSSATTTATRPATPVSPTTLTGEEMCGLLSTADVAPLVYSRTSGKPEAANTNGLAGCRWPVSGARNDFSVFLDKESGGSKREDNAEFADVSFDVNGSKMYRTTSGASVCDAVVFGPKVPATYFLDISYEADKSKLGGQDPCKPTLPVVSKVLTKLGW